PLLNGLDEARGFVQRVVRSGVQPRTAAAEQPNVEDSTSQVLAIDVSDLILPTGGGAERRRDIEDIVVVEVQACDGIVGLWRGGLLLDAAHASVSVQLDDTVALRITNMISEDRCAGSLIRRVRKFIGKLVAVKEVVAQDQRGLVCPHEVTANDECLRQAVRLWLCSIGERHSPTGAVAKQLLEPGQIIRCRDDENVANSGQHEGAERI